MVLYKEDEMPLEGKNHADCSSARIGSRFLLYNIIFLVDKRVAALFLEAGYVRIAHKQVR